MGLFDEEGLRAIIADEVGKAIRGALADKAGIPRVLDQYLSVADAARIAAVAPATIRAWMDDGRLSRYHAGRELRVRQVELEVLLRSAPPAQGRPESSPEAEADRFLERRLQRAQSRRG
jgi:hypothetical protein